MPVVKGANCLYTGLWVSMREKSLKEERTELLKKYQVNKALVQRTENRKHLIKELCPLLYKIKEIEEGFL
ncbi:MAG: hypothetical protein J5817_05440 [Treponema sp.]|nr:hypothetical protein [Treponema sp.]